jgi:Response regulator containing CheY-like receiver domain and AraC-type DNA-binding domain
VLFDFADIINSISIFQLFTFVLFIAITRGKPFYNKILCVFFASELIGILAWVLFKHGADRTTYKLLDLASLLWAPSLYLYADGLTKQREKPMLFALLHLSPFILLLPYTLAASILNFYLMPISQLVSLQVIAYNVAGIITLVKYRRRVKQNYSVDQSKIRDWVTIVLLGYPIACLVPPIFELLQLSSNDFSLGNELIAYTPFLLFFNILFFNAIANPVQIQTLPQDTKYQGSLLGEDVAIGYLNKLEMMMDKDKYYLEPELSLGKLSDKLEIPSRYLSQIINQHKNQSFYDYINRLRTDHACQLLLNANGKTIQEIFFESGFNSKTSFNTAFKKHQGLTPSQYKAKVNG